MTKEEILAGLKADGFYEFVAQNYWQLTKQDLKDIALEYFYATHCHVDIGSRESIVEDAIEREAIEELEDRL